MRNLRLAACVLAMGCASAHAQTSVTTYGKVDLGIANITGQPYQETYNHSSRHGFSGSEDLGDGLYAIYSDPFGQDGARALLLNQLALTRQNNAIRNDSPTFGGFSLHAIYSFTESPDPVSSTSKDGLGASMNYNSGPVSLELGWNRSINPIGTLAASIPFGPPRPMRVTIVKGNYS